MGKGQWSRADHFTRRAGGALMVSLLAACGGGGGGGGSGGDAGSPDTPAPQPTAVITSVNAPVISGAVLEATIAVADVSEVGVLDFAGQFNASVPQASVAGDQPAKALVSVPPQTEFCPYGGSITVSGEIVSESVILAGEFSPGDTIMSNLNGCGIEPLLTLDGGLDFTVTSFSGDLFSGFYDVGMDLTFRNLRFSGSEQIRIDGDLSLSSVTNTSPLLTSTFSATRLDIQLDGLTTTLFDYSQTISVDQSSFPGQFSSTVGGSMLSSAFDGVVDFSTASEFKGFEGSQAESGRMTIVGSGSSAIDVIVLSNQDVELHIDLDGDDVVDEVQIYAWSDLIS